MMCWNSLSSIILHLSTLVLGAIYFDKNVSRTKCNACDLYHFLGQRQALGKALSMLKLFQHLITLELSSSRRPKYTSTTRTPVKSKLNSFHSKVNHVLSKFVFLNFAKGICRVLHFVLRPFQTLKDQPGVVKQPMKPVLIIS